jgi:hypothetical protein
MIRASHFALLAFLFLSLVNACAENCAVCGREIMGDTVYIFTDRVTNEKKHLCNDCSLLPDVCFVCGLPVKENFYKLHDGRVLCARDAKNVVLDPNEPKKICSDVQDEMDRLFSRFTSFPTNVDVHVVDRVSLLALFKVPGNDYDCPDVLGYFLAKTNRHVVRFDISIMSALSRAEVKSTYAHELSHAWVAQNVPSERKKNLGKDSQEGFCELISYLLMDADNEDAEKKSILESSYTRGQIDAFVAAERAHGLNDVLDWMKWGTDSYLDPDDPDRVRVVAMPKEKTVPAPAALVFPQTIATTVPDVLALKGILGGNGHALALINDQSLAVGESAKVRVGTSNVMVRCVAIQGDSVRIQVGDSGEQQVLSLRKEN